MSEFPPKALNSATIVRHIGSLRELLDFKLFGETILVVNKKFRFFLAHPLRK